MYHINYDYLRPKKACWLRRMYEASFPCREDLQVWKGQNATIFPLRPAHDDDLLFGLGGVADSEGQYVALSGLERRVMGIYPFQNPSYRDETVVFCGYLVNHWGHFLVEAVTRMWYALQQDETVDKYVFIYDENKERTLKGNYLEFFRLLNIADKVEIINRPVTYREVIVPEPAFLCMRYHSPQYRAIFDTIAANVVPDPSWETPEKIYFTRSNFAKDNNYDFGLDCLDNFFLRNGYMLLAPETVTLSHMIHLIRNADQIATISGSVHHNMLFGRQGQTLTIMERLIINDDHQVCINQIKELQVTSVDANFHLYPVDTCGPYAVGYNHILERFIADRNMCPPDDRFRSVQYRDSCFKQYMESYQDNYRHRWFMAPWYAEIADSLYEAYEDNYPYFQEYLDGNKPFLREHLFQVHYWKQFIKRLLRR